MSQLKLVPFLARCFAFTLVLSVVWFFVAPGYAQALAASVGVFLSGPLDMQASGHGLNLLIASPSSTLSGTPVSIETLGFGYGMVLTAALALSTPGLRPLSRFLGLGVVWVVLFVAQVAVTSVFGRIAYSALAGGGSPRLVEATLWLLYAVWIVLPPLLWMGWSFRHWLLPGDRAVRGRPVRVGKKRPKAAG